MDYCWRGRFKARTVNQLFLDGQCLFLDGQFIFLDSHCLFLDVQCLF